LRTVSEWLRVAGDAIVETIYPRRCAGCGRRGQWVCDECDPSVRRFSRPWCERCGSPLGHAPCRCRDLFIELDAVRSVAFDEGWLRTAIRSFKYDGESARDAHLGELLVPLIADLPTFDALVPVPLHERRERQRGYNQARLLAEVAARRTSIPVANLLVRVRSTGQQVGLDAAARRANVDGAFAVAGGQILSGRRYVLIDDVLTTGSTLGNCAATLVAAGAAWVGAATLAREQ
jgi:ComF family protein